jgi:hypothetical protein
VVKRVELGAVIVGPHRVPTVSEAAARAVPFSALAVHARRIVWNVFYGASSNPWPGAVLSADFAALDMRSFPPVPLPSIPLCSAAEYALYVDASRWRSVNAVTRACQTFSSGKTFRTIYADMRASFEPDPMHTACAMLSRLVASLGVERLIVEFGCPLKQWMVPELTVPGMVSLTLITSGVRKQVSITNATGTLELEDALSGGCLEALDASGVLSMFGASLYSQLLCPELLPWSGCVSIRDLGGVLRAGTSDARTSLVCENGDAAAYSKSESPCPEHLLCMAARDGDAQSVRALMRWPLQWDSHMAGQVAGLVMDLPDAADTIFGAHPGQTEVLNNVLWSYLTSARRFRIPEGLRARFVEFVLSRTPSGLWESLWRWRGRVPGDYMRSAVWRGEEMLLKAFIRNGIDARVCLNTVMFRGTVIQRTLEGPRQQSVMKCLRMLHEACLENDRTLPQSEDRSYAGKLVRLKTVLSQA